MGVCFDMGLVENGWRVWNRYGKVCSLRFENWMFRERCWISRNSDIMPIQEIHGLHCGFSVYLKILLVSFLIEAYRVFLIEKAVNHKAYPKNSEMSAVTPFSHPCLKPILITQSLVEVCRAIPQGH